MTAPRQEGSDKGRSEKVDGEEGLLKEKETEKGREEVEDTREDGSSAQIHFVLF